MLNVENRRRQSIDEKIFKEAIALVENNGDFKRRRTFVLASDEWHQGVIGIVASRMVEQYNRPTVMISIDPESGEAKGSARSIRGFHLYNAISQCDEYLTGFGGHKYAAGLTMHKQQIEDFRNKFEEVANAILTDEDMVPKLDVVGELDFAQINERLIRLLNMFAPFGPKNMRPVLVSRNLMVDGTPYIVGKKHLKFKLKKGNIVIDAIAFNFGEEKLVDTLKYARPPIDVAYVLEKNTWRNRTTLQARVKDIKIKDSNKI
jgi:single-stranded-DNA-specific exonuclease